VACLFVVSIESINEPNCSKIMSSRVQSGCHAMEYAYSQEDALSDLVYT